MSRIYNSFANQEFFEELKPISLMKLYEFSAKEREVWLTEMKKHKRVESNSQVSPQKKHLQIDNKEIVRTIFLLIFINIINIY